MQITANFKIAQSDCLQSEELYSVVQTLSSFFTPSNHSYYSKFLVLTAIEKGFLLLHKNRSVPICKALQVTEFF